MHAFFANCVYEMHIPWAVEGLPTLLHLSVLIFFGGLVFFFSTIDHAVFGPDFVDQAFLNRVWTDHSDADCLAPQPILCTPVLTSLVLVLRHEPCTR